MTCYLIRVDKDAGGQLHYSPWIYTVAREIDSIMEGYEPGKNLFKICPPDDKEETAIERTKEYLEGQLENPAPIKRWARKAKDRFEEFKRTGEIPNVPNTDEWE